MMQTVFHSMIIHCFHYNHILLYRTEKDKASPSPYLSIYHNGQVEFRNDQVVLSTCKMHVYKFPFDTQSCNLSFKSIFHDGESITVSVYMSFVWS